jgi:hypothetical protein
MKRINIPDNGAYMAHTALVNHAAERRLARLSMWSVWGFWMKEFETPHGNTPHR